MARKVTYQQVTETVTHNQMTETFHCDGCGREIDSDEPEDDDAWANELLVYLNPGQCVDQGFGRDLCRACVLPIWDTICKAIGADPEDLSKESLEGRRF